jgi:DNA-binding CsgD family transcriptional regulator
MVALYRSGRQAEALEVYRDTRRVLVDELGLEPSRELQALETAIIGQDPALVVQPEPPGRAPTDRSPQLPGPLRPVPPYPFVGRTDELATLSGLVPLAEGKGRRVALVSGEAGSGKSRLARELAHAAAAEGVLVLYGACDAVVRVPYRPFIEALDHLVEVTEVDALRADIGAAGGELVRLLPALAQTVGELTGPIVADPDTERHRLHTSVTDLLICASRRQPLLLILEDGHWADTPTLLLLRHLARAAMDARLLVLATFRDTEAEVPAGLADALAELRRSDGVVRIRLAGLGEEDVAKFVEGSAAGEIDVTPPGLAHALRDLTEGNPFLLCEVWRALVETGTLRIGGGAVRLARPLDEFAAPESVREIVSQRLSRLPERTRDLLGLAAVAGPAFEFDILRRAAPADLEPLHALEPAERSGMIETIPSPRLAYRFTHELVRRALVDGLTSVRRAELHLGVAEALEAAEKPRSGRALANLAHHFAVAAPVGGRERAVDYNLLAANAATVALAFDETAARLQTALAIGIDDEHRRAATQLDLGTAAFRAGRSLDSLQPFRDAAEIGRRLGDAELLAHAAIGLERACWRGRLGDEGAIELLEAASAALPDDESALRVRVLAGLGRALALCGDHRGSALVGARAIGMARRIDDPGSLATALVYTAWAHSCPSFEIEMVTESRDLAGEIGDVETQADATVLRVAALAARGEIEAARRQLSQAIEMARRVRQPFLLYASEQHASAIALLEGRLVEAETAAERSRDWGRLLTGADPAGAYGIQIFGIRREQGRLNEFGSAARVMASSQVHGAWRPALAALLAELGMDEDVGRELAQVRLEGLDRLRGSVWIASLTYLADACSAIGDDAVAALVYPELAAFAGTNLVVGYSVSLLGAADRYLGMLAATLQDTERARLHFDAALELNRRMGATTWLAHTCYEYGRLCQAHEDWETAEPLLAEAASLAEWVGMPALLDRIRALSPTQARRRALPHGLSEREAEVLRLVSQGLSNREIGAALSISVHTAANHVRSILRKASCANRTDATSFAHRHGLAET